MGPLELCRFLDRRLLQHQYMDDFVVEHNRWAVLVAILDMRLGAMDITRTDKLLR